MKNMGQGRGIELSLIVAQEKLKLIIRSSMLNVSINALMKYRLVQNIYIIIICYINFNFMQIFQTKILLQRDVCRTFAKTIEVLMFPRHGYDFPTFLVNL